MQSETMARQPQVLRAHMRDHQYRNIFHYYMLQAAEVFVPFRTLKKYENELKLLADLGYISLTFTFLDKLTLGQEYGEIKPSFRPPKLLQSLFNKSDSIPFTIRMIYTLIACFGNFMLRRKKQKYEEWANAKIREASQIADQEEVASVSVKLANNKNNPIRAWPGFLRKWWVYFKCNVIANQLPTSIDSIVSVVDEFHLALFFIFGRYYEISRRLTGLLYVFRSERPNHKITYTLPGRLLMFKLLFQFLVVLKNTGSCLWSSFKQLRREFTQLEIERKLLEIREREGFSDMSSPEVDLEEGRAGRESNSEDSQNEALLCSLCYNKRVNTAATQCGHLFCWSCILQSLAVRQECPQCRAPAIAEKVVQLRNLS